MDAMTERDLIDLVRRYFDAVDGEDFEAIRATLADGCVFTVETHGIRFVGVAEIRTMFDRLWADHASVRHYDFIHVAAPGDGRVASRFSVINTLADGRRIQKSNSNFFEVSDGRFSRIAVYMSGENTLTRT